MNLQVPYIADEIIELDAEALLADYARRNGVEISVPIPIENIVEKQLKLHVGFDDLHRRLGVPRNGLGLDPDILGASWFEAREIVIDESLDPEEHPSREGRYRFTLAHEGGHWRLHRPLVQANRRQESLFGHPRQPTVIYRSSQSKERAELQADLYASCLLMPRTLVRKAWCERFGNENPWVLRRADQIPLLSDVDEEVAEQVRFFDQERDQQALEDFARPFAKRFLVSPIAMRIRLERLRLLHREIPRQRWLFAT
jgi:Zn-dependent peptidase ImmA (M78 family)